MANIVPAPFTLKDAVLTLDGNTYDGVDGVTFTPDTPVNTWKSITGKVFQDIGVTAWTCTIDGVQDHETANSLSLKFLSATSTPVTGNFKPKGSGTKSYNFSAVLRPTQIGGKANDWATFSAEIALSSGPTPIP